MKPTTRRACLALALLATAGLAVAQTTTTAPTSQPQVQFKVVDTPFEVATPPGDPALQNNKYVAVFRYEKPRPVLVLASTGQPEGPSPGALRPRAGSAMTVKGQPENAPGSTGMYMAPPGAATAAPMPMLPPGMGMATGAGDGSTAEFEPWLASVLNNLPANDIRALSDRISALLSTQGGTAYVRWVPADTARKGSTPPQSIGRDGIEYVLMEMVPEIQVLAPTVEQAEELSKALITALVQGDSTRVQVQRRIKELQAQLDNAREKLAKAKAKLVELDAKLQQLEEVDPEAMKELKKERLLLTVQIAGTKARMEAAKAQITSSPSSPSDQAKNRQLEEITSATSIEMAGLLASQQQIRNLIFEGNERQELIAQRKTAQEEAHVAERAMRGLPAAEHVGEGNYPLIEDSIKELQAVLADLDLRVSKAGVVNIYPIKRPASSGTAPSTQPSPQPMAPSMGMPSPASPMIPPAR